MSFLPSNGLQSFIPNDLIIPETFPDANLILTEYIRQLVDAVNLKDIGQYNTVETVNGQTFFTPGDANDARFVFRKVIDFGALPNATTKSVAHNINVSAGTIFTRVYAVATHPTNTDPNPKSLPIPFVDPNTSTNGIELYVTDTNAVIITAANYSAYTTCYVIVEYIKE